MQQPPYLGKGWTFPPVFDRVTGQAAIAKDLIDIEQSLEILLSTRPGERLLRPRFGINMDALLFEPITVTLLTSMQDQIETAIALFEPRIEVVSVDLEDTVVTEGRVDVHIEYRVLSTNSRLNFVYPFYVEEKTESIR